MSDTHQLKVRLSKRLRVLLKENTNKNCSECGVVKPKWMAILETNIPKKFDELRFDQEKRTFGVFCCDGCSQYFKSLKGCQLKSLNRPGQCESFVENVLAVLLFATFTQLNSIQLTPSYYYFESLYYRDGARPPCARKEWKQTSQCRLRSRIARRSQ